MVFTKNERIVLIVLVSGFCIGAAVRIYEEAVQRLPETDKTVQYTVRDFFLHDPEKPETECVNINLASEHTLVALPGVGPVIAKRIVAFRETNGPFTDLESLKEVKGIGNKTFEKIKPFITIALKEDS